MNLRYPKGQQDFASIREEGKVYVDKTDLIYKLVNNEKYVFLARPRRFGKSLLLSTIKAFFEGRKELFEGLAIYDLEKVWKKHPVIEIELSRAQANDPKALESLLGSILRRYEEKYNIKPIDNTLTSRFDEIVRKAFEITGEKVVVLIDEYDNPLINTIHLREIHENNRNLLKSVYSNLKPLDPYIQFAMLTGVSRFSKTSIFSGLNNLSDITFFDQYSSICGFTEEEIRQFLKEGVEELSKKQKINFDEAIKVLKEEYDGYHFSEECPDIYNPYSLLFALDLQRISDYWIVSGTPGFLVERLKNNPNSFNKIFNDSASEQGLAAIDTAFSSPVSLLYQTGYLTIKAYNKETRKYKLGIPNKEIDRGLFPALLSGFTQIYQDGVTDLSNDMCNFLKEGNPEEFLSRLQCFMAEIPYGAWPEVKEVNFQHILYLILRTASLEVDAESATSFGRRDIIVKTNDYIYIFELKLDQSSEKAINQIKEKQYSLPYKYDGRKIYLMGLNFSSETRNLEDWIIETE